MTKLRPYLMRKKAPLFGSMLLSTLAVAFGLVPYVIVYMLCVRIFERSGDTADFLTLAGIALAAIHPDWGRSGLLAQSLRCLQPFASGARLRGRQR